MRKVVDGVSDLMTVNPDVAAQWHPTKNGDLTPSQVAAFSNDTAWWQCQYGHEWPAVIKSRHKAGCPVCSGRKPLTGVNDLATVNPGLAAQWHPTKNGDLTPQTVLPNSGKEVWWQCEYGHEWPAKIQARSRGNGCPYCSGYLPIPGETDLATTHPELAAQWHPTKNGKLTPRDVKKSTEKKVWWLGPCGHEWDARIKDRTDEIDQCGCPYCAGKRALVGFNDLGTTHPELAAEWHPTKNGAILPTQVTAGSNKKYWWVCKEGHEYKAACNHRSGPHKSGCPFCAEAASTSFPETAVLLYVTKFFPDTISPAMFPWLGRKSIDIYIPSLKTAIEYDGQAWHKNTDAVARDKDKTRLCKDNGIRLIRIREPNLPPIDGECINLNSLDLNDLNIAIRILLCDFLQHTDNIDVNILRDSEEIECMLKRKKNLLSNKMTTITPLAGQIILEELSKE